MKDVSRILWKILLFFAITTISISLCSAQHSTLLTESFETGSGTTPPAGWAIEQVTGTIPGVSFITTSADPAITAAYDGSKFTGYNSMNIPVGSTRLKQTIAISTAGNTLIMVDFAWYEDPGNAAANDKVEVEWSTDGATWNTAGAFTRYNAVTGWKVKNLLLPAGASNQNTLYIAFLFTSGYGNNCALDLVHVTGGPPSPPPFATIGTDTTSLVAYPYTTYYMGARTQMLYTAAQMTAAGVPPGNLTSIGFNVVSASGQTMQNFTVSMGHTSSSSFSAFVAGLTTVYQNNYSVPGTGWRNIVLASPFNWNGTSNVIVEVCYGNNGSYTLNSAITGTAAANVCRHYHTDNYAGCTGGASGANQPMLPNIRFGISQVNPGILTGIVRDINTLQPIAGAVVTVGAKRDTTRANGMYAIYYLNAGSVIANTAASGYTPNSAAATITVDGVTNQDFLMLPGPRVGGVVTDASTGLPVTGASVTIGTGMSATTTYTIAGGTFLTPPLPISGAQPMLCGMTGYDACMSSVTLVPNTTTTQGCALLPTAVQPGPFTAVLTGTPATSVNLTWSSPQGMYQLIYDDGIQDDFTVWGNANNLNAIKVTPYSWPAQLYGGKVDLGTAANYPPNALPLAQFTILACKADGVGGTPGTVADSVVVYPGGYGWTNFSFATPVNINSGDFYLVMKQGGTTPHAAGIGLDLTGNQLRSYSRNVTAGGSWTPVTGNLMMRASLKGAGAPPTQGVSYQVWRLQQGQEGNQAPWTSVWTGTANSTVDNTWPALPDGPYRWAVSAIYSPPGVRLSSPTLSNVIGKNWTAVTNVCVTLSCAVSSKAGTYVRLTNTSTPDTIYSGLTDTSGCISFTKVWKGNYTLTVSRFYYQDYNQSVTITGNATFAVTPLKQATPPANLAVDALNLTASWNFPMLAAYQLQEDWAGGSFSTNQWVVSGGTNWQVSTPTGNPAPSVMFNAAPALTNYDQYLTSKSMANFPVPKRRLKYDIFLDNLGTATSNTLAVELWDGTAWSVLKTYDNQSGYDLPWTSETLNIPSMTGNPAFKIRFHASGGSSNDIRGWYLDNIKVVNSDTVFGPGPCLSGYAFYLNGSLLGSSPDTAFSIPPGLVTYGQTYQACVKAVYGDLFSSPICVNFTSYFLYPPRNLTAAINTGTVTLNWNAPEVPLGLTGYNIYRNYDLLNPAPVAALDYVDPTPVNGLNIYMVRAVYGENESMPAGPVVVNFVPVLRALNDLVASDGETRCYNAVQTITVAGGGTTFTVENGGSATMIAGQNIIYYPGTTVIPGGYLWGYIAPSGPYCTYPAMPVVATTEEKRVGGKEQFSVKVYPNPTSGIFMLELEGEPARGEVVADIYGICGECVLHTSLNGEHRKVLSMENRPAGVYFLRVVATDKTATAKIIRQ
ncbi:MAG: T9SS type A sorting domain-containing protein [Bacteroidales bacterium]